MIVQELERQRSLGSRALLGALWLHVPVIGAVGLLMGQNWLALAVAATLCAGVATATDRGGKGGSGGRVAVAVAVMGTISMLLAALQGDAWQTDLHMYYFAALAVLAVYCDWVVILAAAATVAVHHTVLNFLLPYLLYPGGQDFGRLVLHAAVLIGEALPLLWLSVNMEQSFVVRERARLAELHTRDVEAQAMDAAHRQRLELDAERLRVREDQAAGAQATVVKGLAHGLRQLTDGRLNFRITTPFAAEYDGLRNDYNLAMAALEDTMAQIAGSAGTLRADAEEIDGAAIDLSGRTDQQAASLKDTAAAVERIAAVIRKTADDTTAAGAAVAAAQAGAASSGAVVAQAVAAMGSIDESSRQISTILAVIDEIAFQTNLLALNAGVEAARAGDAGRGFAVVATEVRGLAHRSSEAAREIRGIIAVSARHVDAGVSLVGQTGEALQTIVRQVGEISLIVGRIAQAAQAQASGLELVTGAMSLMDRVTRQNMSMVGEGRATSRRVAQETEVLTGLIGRFEAGRLDDAAKSKPPRRRAG